MSDALERRAIFRELIGKFDVFSHGSWEITLEAISVHILEMEDVLFHHNSAVMMPENPQGASSQDGAEGTRESTKKDQEKISGVKALALVFKQFEFNPDQSIIIAGHTDTSGETKFNFDLSGLRAQNILHLLTGDRKQWAKACYKRHKVEDYQQIMQYLWVTRGWPCDPGPIDDKWGDKTRHATEAFINSYNVIYAYEHKAKDLPASAANKAHRDGKHRWPESLWRGVYDLYDEDLRSVLGVTPEEMNTLRSNRLRFADKKKKYVGCGESFPVDQAEKENYRSQANRRVVILFFDKDEAPVMDCPKVTKRVHREAECPLWHNWHFQPLYIDPNDLYAVVYHMKFAYYDRVLKEVKGVPKGLKIKAFENGSDELTTSCRVKDGVYSVKVQFKTPLDDKNRKSLHFEFETTNQWVYTKDADSEPKIETKTPDEIKDLNKLENAEKRTHYYDLPDRWSSRNYWTRYDGDMKTGSRFERVVAEVKKLKPFGSGLTEPAKPLIFSLDDIVLVSEKVDQNLFDRSGWPDSSYPKGITHDLSERSRVRLLYVDPETKYLKVHSTEELPVHPTGTGAAYDTELATYQDKVKKFEGASLIRFLKDNDGKYRNLLTAPPSGTRAVIFCGELYDVTAKRTVMDKKVQFGRGHIVGARAAILNDESVHTYKRIEYKDKIIDVHTPGIGDFCVHYLHGSDVLDKKLCSYLVVYWSAFVMKDTNPSTGPTAVGKKEPATDDEVNEFKSIGMFNSMNHWNKKEYQFEEHGVAADDAKHIIRPFYMFEAYEEFSLTAPDAPIDYFKKRVDLVKSAKFKQDLKNSRGGIPYSLVFITEENKGSWVLSARTTTPPFSIVSLRRKTREDQHDRFNSVNTFPTKTKFPYNEFNDPGQYGCQAMAHELGHATGQIDDYLENAKEKTSNGPPPVYLTHEVPSYSQFGIGREIKDKDGHIINAEQPGCKVEYWMMSAYNNYYFGNRIYSSEAYPIAHDDKTMMDKNGPIRMRHVWRFVQWLNTGGLDPEKIDSVSKKPVTPLKKFLSDAQFEMVYKHPDANNPMKYFRTDGQKKNPWAATHNAKLYAKPAPNQERPMNVYLYQKPGETRRDGNKDYQAVLAVRVFLSVKFPGGWNNNTKTNWTSWFDNMFTHYKDLLPGHFYLSDNSGSGLDPIIIRFLAGYDFYTGANPGHTHYHYRIELDNDATVWAIAGDKISVGNSKAKRKKLFWHLFNKPAGSAEFVEADFGFISNWFNTTVVPGGHFRVKKK